MNNISQYIIEKLHLNKDINSESCLEIISKIVNWEELTTDYKKEMENLLKEINVNDIEDFSNIFVQGVKFMRDDCDDYTPYTKKYCTEINFDQIKNLELIYEFVPRIEQEDNRRVSLMTKKGSKAGFAIGYAEAGNVYNVIFLK